MVRETTLSRDDLILPLFVVPGSGVEREVGSMPGVFQQSVERAVETAVRARDLGIPAVLLFGLPEKKGYCKFPTEYIPKLGQDLWTIFMEKQERTTA